jgi:hypothetical protein
MRIAHALSLGGIMKEKVTKIALWVVGLSFLGWILWLAINIEK